MGGGCTRTSSNGVFSQEDLVLEYMCIQGCKCMKVNKLAVIN